MAHVLIPHAESHDEGIAETQAKSRTTLAHSSAFNYYIHDSVNTLSFQLIGDMRCGNVTELNGSWETAKPTLGQRRLVLDLTSLHSTDEHSRRWLLNMKASGAIFLPDLEIGNNTRSLAARAGSSETLSLLGKFLDTFKPKP
jgi:hypothetical protein